MRIGQELPACIQGKTPREHFRPLTHCVGRLTGSPGAFLASMVVIIIWAALGPYFHFSDRRPLVINTGTTIITILMVFLIQHMQNCDSKVIHLKLDELIRSVKGAQNNLVMLENLSDEEIERLEKQFVHISEKHREHVRDTEVAAVTITPTDSLSGNQEESPIVFPPS